MPDLSDEQRERQIRSRGNAATKEMRALLRLLDAERARADAAEALFRRAVSQMRPQSSADMYGPDDLEDLR